MTTHGTITVMGVPARGVEVYAVRGGKVVAVAHSDPEGRFAVDVDAEQVLARFVEPAVGVRAATPGADGAVQIAVERADIVRLTGTLATPAGVTIDWIDLWLTPRLPEVAPRIVVAVGTENAQRPCYWARRLTGAGFELRLLRGTWAMWLVREEDGGLTAEPPLALTLDTLLLPNGDEAEAHFGGRQFALDRDLQVTARVRVRTEDEL